MPRPIRVLLFLLVCRALGTPATAATAGVHTVGVSVD
jgi:hypothetical protein